MIVITGTARLAEGAREQMLEAATAMAEATRQEPGCNHCQYGFDLQDPLLMTFHESFEDMAALQAHMGSEHMRAFYGAGEQLMAGRPDLTMWVNAEKGSMGPG